MHKNVPCIPPIFHKNRVITDIREKTELFNCLLPNQCSLIRNGSVLFTDYELFADKSLSNITFADNDIGRMKWSLHPNKGQGHNMMSICMLKICGDSIYKPLGRIFRACLEHGVFPQNWIRSNLLFLFIKNTTNSQ